MNFIAWNYAISLYPSATFIQGYSACSYDMSNCEQHQPVTDLEDRGFIFLDSSDEEYEKRFFPGETRRVGDNHCWTVFLTEEGVEEAISPWLMANTWTLVEHDTGGFWMETGLVRSCLLRHSYCVAGSLISRLASTYADWWVYKSD